MEKLNFGHASVHNFLLLIFFPFWCSIILKRQIKKQKTKKIKSYLKGWYTEYDPNNYCFGVFNIHLVT